MMADYEVSFVPSCPGERFKIVYEPKVNPDGTLDLIEAGKEDLQEFYNSQAAACDMAVLLSRYFNGDKTALEQRQGAYFDSTMVPKTYAEMLQTVINGQRSFEALPIEIKKKFNNDFNQWFASAGSEEWQSKMTDSTPRTASAPTDASLEQAEKAPAPATK